MRLWHKDMLPVLPRQQLLSQWRECCSIAINIRNNGTPNQVLVNKVMEYKLSHFYKYCCMVAEEMSNRGYNISDRSIEKIFDSVDSDIRMGSIYINPEELFNGWHNDRYLIQCYYNLQEKFDCGGVTENEFLMVQDLLIKRNLI